MKPQIQKPVGVIIALTVLILIGWGVFKPQPTSKQVDTAPASPENVDRDTKRSHRPHTAPDSSGEHSQSLENQSSGYGEIKRVAPLHRNSQHRVAARPPQWKDTMPASVPSVPPGAMINPPEVSATVDGRKHLPRFQGGFSDRMQISSKGRAALSVKWPLEHQTEEILVSTINDGLVNGQPGDVVRKGTDGRFRFSFEAGPHTC